MRKEHTKLIELLGVIDVEIDCELGLFIIGLFSLYYTIFLIQNYIFCALINHELYIINDLIHRILIYTFETLQCYKIYQITKSYKFTAFLPQLCSLLIYHIIRKSQIFIRTLRRSELFLFDLIFAILILVLFLTMLGPQDIQTFFESLLYILSRFG